MPPERAQIFQQGIDQLRDSGIADQALKVGTKAPDFALPNAKGANIKLSDLLKGGPIVLAWYRGGWCPYCNIELKALQQALPKIRELGGTLVAITPETPDNAAATIEKDELAFEVLSDVGNTVAREYKLVFKLSDPVAAELKQLVDLSKFNGDQSNELPLAATFVIDAHGIIRFAFADPDYRNRAEPAAILGVLKQLKENPPAPPEPTPAPTPKPKPEPAPEPKPKLEPAPAPAPAPEPKPEPAPAPPPEPKPDPAPAPPPEPKPEPAPAPPPEPKPKPEPTPPPAPAPTPETRNPEPAPAPASAPGPQQ